MPERPSYPSTNLSGTNRPLGIDLLDDFHFRLLAEIAQLVLRIADAASHIDAAFFGEAIVLLIDADDFRLEPAVRFRSQPHEGRLADCSGLRPALRPHRP